MYICIGGLQYARVSVRCLFFNPPPPCTYPTGHITSVSASLSLLILLYPHWPSMFYLFLLFLILLHSNTSSTPPDLLILTFTLGPPLTFILPLHSPSPHHRPPNPLSLSPLLHQPPLQVLAAIPEGCEPSECDYYAAWTQNNNFDFVDFTLAANVQGWLALGLSADRVMVSRHTYVRTYSGHGRESRGVWTSYG